MTTPNTDTPIAQKLVFLTGAGVVRDAWEPVFRAVKSVYPNVPSRAYANDAMANLVFNLRWWWRYDADRKSRGDLALCEPLKGYMQGRADLCEAIAKELSAADANGEIGLQAGFEFVWNRFIGAGPDFRVVTTNWDRVMDRHVEHWFPDLKDHVFHLHGDTTKPNSLLLPSEVAFESYYDRATEREALLRHAQIMHTVAAADALVIYGLSLSPLDAELSQLISAAIDTSESNKVIHIVDLRPNDVADRLRSVLQKNHPEIHCWVPPQAV